MRIRPLFPLLFALFMATSTGWSQSASQQKTPTSVVRDEFLRAYNDHDTEAVLALYADDAVLLSEAGVFRGRAEIRKWLQFAMDQGSVLESITPIREKSSKDSKNNSAA